MKGGVKISTVLCTHCASLMQIFHKWVAHSKANLNVFLCKRRRVLVPSSKQQNRSMSVHRHQYQYPVGNISLHTKIFSWFRSLFNLYFWTISWHISSNTFAKPALSNYQELNINLKRQWMCPEKFSLSLNIHHSINRVTVWFNQTETFSKQIYESILYILCGSPKCLFSNLKLYKLCKYMFVRHALLVINCCTGSRQQNSSTITDWQNNNKESNAAA